MKSVSCNRSSDLSIRACIRVISCGYHVGEDRNQILSHVMFFSFSGRHSAAGMLLRAETIGSALRHEVMADCVVPLLRVSAQLPAEVAEQCAVFVICTAAHPLSRHIHEIPQVVLADDPRLHAERQPHRGILVRDAELVQPGKMLLNFRHQFVIDRLCSRMLCNAWRDHIVKAMLIVDIARAGLQPRRLAADMGVPLPDHPC